jgi:hypothetical protein
LILLASDPVAGTFSVALSASSVVLRLARTMLSSALLLEVGRPERVAESLLHVALGGVELAGGLTARRSICGRSVSIKADLGEDIMV